MTLVTHKSTKQQIDNFITNPSHAIALVGSKGVGKKALAIYISERLLGKKISENTSELFITSSGSTGSISIENVREIVSFLKLKAPGQSNIKRIVIIENAHFLTIEAQNALLKTLEEPANDAVIILTTTNKNSLLATINSRVKHISIATPLKKDVIDFFSDQHDLQDVEKNWLISNGRVGLLHSLLTEQEHGLLPYIQEAKSILSSDIYGKLSSIERLTKQDVNLLLEALFIVSSAGFYQATNKREVTLEKKWHQIRSTVFKAQNSLNYNVNSKLLLCNLMLEL